MGLKWLDLLAIILGMWTSETLGQDDTVVNVCKLFQLGKKIYFRSPYVTCVSGLVWINEEAIIKASFSTFHFPRPRLGIQK